MSTDNRTLRRQLARELTYLEDRYLALQDLKSDGALATGCIPDKASDAWLRRRGNKKNLLRWVLLFLTVHTVPSHHF